MGAYKKKVDTELRTYFPGWFGDDLEHLENLRRWYLLRTQEDINEADKKTFERLQQYFLYRNIPMCFNPYDENCVLIKEDREFEEICNSLDEAGAIGSRSGTVFEFYSKLQYLEKKALKQRSHGN